MLYRRIWDIKNKPYKVQSSQNNIPYSIKADIIYIWPYSNKKIKNNDIMKLQEILQHFKYDILTLLY